MLISHGRMWKWRTHLIPTSGCSSCSMQMAWRLCINLMQPNALAQIKCGDGDNKNEHWIRAHAFANKLTTRDYPYRRRRRAMDTFCTQFTWSHVANGGGGIKLVHEWIANNLCNISRCNRNATRDAADAEMKCTSIPANGFEKSISTLWWKCRRVEHIMMMMMIVGFLYIFPCGPNQFKIVDEGMAHVSRCHCATDAARSPQHKQIALCALCVCVCQRH